jgi:hypothetical protein
VRSSLNDAARRVHSGLVLVEPTEAIHDPLDRLRAPCESFLSHLERRLEQAS